MKVPNIINEKFVDEDGVLTNSWRTVLSTLITQMQIHLSDEGFVLPTQPTANINQLAIPQKNGALLIDSDTDEVKININGTMKKFTLT
jgi:hypothetical protein